MRLINKILYVFIFFSIVYISAVYYFVINEKKEYVEMLNKEVILKNDTLTIIDYSQFDETYTLDNGLKYDKNFIEKLKFIKDDIKP